MHHRYTWTTIPWDKIVCVCLNIVDSNLRPSFYKATLRPKCHFEDVLVPHSVLWDSFDVSDLSDQNRRVLDAIAESEKMDSRGRMDLLSRVSEDLRHSIDEVESERRSLMALMGELNRKIISTTQEADCTYHERRLLHHILHNRDYTIEGAAASLGLREAEVRIILESLQHRGLTQ